MNWNTEGYYLNGNPIVDKVMIALEQWNMNHGIYFYKRYHENDLAELKKDPNTVAIWRKKQSS